MQKLWRCEDNSKSAKQYEWHIKFRRKLNKSRKNSTRYRPRVKHFQCRSNNNPRSARTPQRSANEKLHRILNDSLSVITATQNLQNENEVISSIRELHAELSIIGCTIAITWIPCRQAYQRTRKLLRKPPNRFKISRESRNSREYSIRNKVGTTSWNLLNRQTHGTRYGHKQNRGLTSVLSLRR